MSSRGPDWFTDAYTHSPGATDLLSFYGAEHALGESSDTKSPRPLTRTQSGVAAIQRMSTAYLRTALRIDETSWPAAGPHSATTPTRSAESTPSNAAVIQLIGRS